MLLCCQREAIYLTAPWKNKLTAGQAVTADVCGVHCRRGAHCLCSSFSNRLSFSSFHRLVLFLSFLSSPFSSLLLDEVIIPVTVYENKHAEGHWCNEWRYICPLLSFSKLSESFLVSLRSLFWLYGPCLYCFLLTSFKVVIKFFF